MNNKNKKFLKSHFIIGGIPNSRKNNKAKDKSKPIKEGAGAAVTFHFKRGVYPEPDFSFDGLTIKVKNLCISDYYYDRKVYDAGKIVFDKNAIIDDLAGNEFYALSKDEIANIVSVKIVDVDEIPDLDYSWGWTRVGLPSGTVLTWGKNARLNGYLPLIQVEVVYKDGKKEYMDAYADAKFYPSDELVGAYSMLGVEDENNENYSESSIRSLAKKAFTESCGRKVARKVVKEASDADKLALLNEMLTVLADYESPAHSRIAKMQLLCKKYGVPYSK